jgi:hypothetical protein
MAGGIRMKKTIILLLSLLILSGCTYETEEKTIYGELTDAGYILDEIDITDLDFDVAFISAKSITDTLSDDHGIIYEVSSDDVGIFYQNRIDYSNNANDIVFIYKAGNYVFEMHHSTTSTFPGFMRHYEFEANFQYHIYFSGEMEEQTIYDELTDAGYILAEIGTTDLDFEVTVVSSKSIHDSLSDDFGIIYEVSNEDVESFYTDRQDYSYLLNDIVFIYKVENYVLEMYHSTTSTFAGFMRHYDFEANFQYELFFSGELEYHPLIQRMFDNGGYIWKEETEEHIVEYHDAYNRLNLQIESIRIIPFNNVSYTVVEYKSSEEAYQAFIYQDTLNAGTFNSFRYYVQYQNYVFIIDVLNVHIDLIYTPFEDVDFVAYSHEDAQYLPWEGN